MNIKNNIRKYLSWLYTPIRKFLKYCHDVNETSRLNYLKGGQDAVARIYYLGITSHSNLGDMAQHYCIKKWILENYPNHELVMFESDTVVDDNHVFLNKFKKVYRKQDIIVFQSGYTTQDMGGNHEYMHRLIVDNIPEANILMMPQTIFFVHEENKRKCAESLDKAHHMLFLARDFISEKSAKEMFPHQRVMAFPDIVTTLIGTLQFNNERKGVCLCCRNDVEKYYSDKELEVLQKKLEMVEPVSKTDTTIKAPYKEIRDNLKKYIKGEIEKFSHYKVVITDRYHGTIFAIAAGTPVVIIKTTDHKVTTGADWFKGVYDENVRVAENLDDAYSKAIDYINNERSHTMNPYFKQNYYDKLKGYFEEVMK